MRKNLLKQSRDRCVKNNIKLEQVDPIELYEMYLTGFEQLVGNGETYNFTLDRICKGLFKGDFMGVYAYDRIPNLGEDQCLIFNLDKAGEPGSHWCSMYKKAGSRYVYDSFGRRVMPQVKNSELDAEQNKKEENCGQRCIAWLCVVYMLGISKALKI